MKKLILILVFAVISNSVFAGDRDKLLWMAGGSLLFGSSAYSASHKAKAEGKRNPESLIMVGDLFFVASISCVAYYFSDVKLSGSGDKVTLFISKKF